jgi:hydrogenase maturation protease
MRALILGVGNILLTDEGIGVRAAEYLMQNYTYPNNVSILDGGTMGMELLGYITETDILIILDAIGANQEAGSLIIMQDDEIPAFFASKLSPHQVGIADVLGAARLLGKMPQITWLLGLVPQSLALQAELSPNIAAAIPQLAEKTAMILNNYGIELTMIN